MRQNIAITLERGEDLNVLSERTEELGEATSQFRTEATHAKRRMWWRNTKLMIAIVIFAILLLALICKL